VNLLNDCGFLIGIQVGYSELSFVNSIDVRLKGCSSQPSTAISFFDAIRCDIIGGLHVVCFIGDTYHCCVHAQRTGGQIRKDAQ